MVDANGALRTCPCCGSHHVDDVTGEMASTKQKIYKVYCKICQLRTGPEFTKEKARKVWNRRPQ